MFLGPVLDRRHSNPEAVALHRCHELGQIYGLGGSCLPSLLKGSTALEEADAVRGLHSRNRPMPSTQSLPLEMNSPSL